MFINLKDMVVGNWKKYFLGFLDSRGEGGWKRNKKMFTFSKGKEIGKTN
jgi:hypothetical protein